MITMCVSLIEFSFREVRNKMLAATKTIFILGAMVIGFGLGANFVEYVLNDLNLIHEFVGALLSSAIFGGAADFILGDIYG